MITNDNIDLKLVFTTIEEELNFSCASSQQAEWMKAFIKQVNDLIAHDFNRLVLILYKLDISETKLRILLKAQSHDKATDTAETICNLIIERQIEKLISRSQFPRNENIGEDERW